MAEGITIIPGDQTSLEIPEDDRSISRLPEDIIIEVEVSQAAPQLEVRYGHDAIHLLMNEISLSIRDVSLIELIGNNSASIIHEQNVRIDENHILAEDVLTIKGSLTDPSTGNVALAAAIESLSIEINNHYGAMDAHATKFVSLETSINDVANDVQVNSSAVQTLSSDVSANRDGWMANASDITSLQVSVNLQDGRIQTNASLNQVSLVKIIANENSISVHGESITTIEGSITNSIEPSISANASAIDGIEIQITDDENGLMASASRITELQVGISNSLNPTLAWEFRDSTDGWLAGDSAQVTQADDALILDCTYGDGYAYVELDSPISGDLFPYLILRWKRLTGSNWVGQVYYKYSGFGSWVLAESFDEPSNALDYTSTTLDMRDCGWDVRTITHLAIKLSDAVNNSFAIDSVGLGRIGSLGPYAYIKENLDVWVAEDSTLAQRVDVLEASVDTNSVLITEETTARVEADGVIQGSYILKIDINGYISGFGLMSEVLDDEPVSAFIVLADEFAVVLPGTVDNPVVPFSAGTYHNMPAVTIANAFIGDIIQSENYDDVNHRHGWQIRLSGTGQGQAEFNNITIRDSYGKIVLSSGDGLQWENIQGAEKPSDGATRNFIYRTTSTPVDAQEGDLWYHPITFNLKRYSVIDGWAIVGNYVTHTSNLTDDANLGATAIWSQVAGGAEKPTDYADVTSESQAMRVVNQGLFATLDKITKDNVFTYMEDAVIGTAFIGELAVVSAKIGELQVGTSKITNGAVSNLTSVFTPSMKYWTNDIKTIQSLGIISYEERKTFLISCSATLLLPTCTIGGEDDYGLVHDVAWGVYHVNTGQYIYDSEIVPVPYGPFQLSFSLEHSPSGTGPLLYEFQVGYTCNEQCGVLHNIRVTNRSMFMAEFKK
jgi:hypothetical protein